MQIHIFVNTTERIAPRQKFLSPIKYYNKYCTLDILRLIIYFFIVLDRVLLHELGLVSKRGRSLSS